MTTAGPNRPRTALALLFGTGDSATILLAQAVLPFVAGDLDRALAKLKPETRDGTKCDVGDAAAALLKNVDLIDQFVNRLRELHDLISAARRTLAAPGSTELVQLATYEITWPLLGQRVIVLVDGKRVATLQLDLRLVFDITAVLARIRAGKLVAFLTGRCDITADLTINDRPFVPPSLPRLAIELPGEVALDLPIRLLPDSDYPPDDNGHAL